MSRHFPKKSRIQTGRAISGGVQRSESQEGCGRGGEGNCVYSVRQNLEQKCNPLFRVNSLLHWWGILNEKASVSLT